MKLPPIHNTRSPQQWKIISKHIDFKDKAVLDLGCGYGDILFRCWRAGARAIQGIDNNEEIIRQNYEHQPRALHSEISFLCLSINTVIGRIHSNFDIIICFSVLPYLENDNQVLRWIRHHCDIALIECQYAGDGYGYKEIENDEDMKAWLTFFGWESIEPIGKTLVKGRNKSRTIWRCQ